MVSTKRMDKLLRSGAEVYLAVILPSSIHKSRVTQKVKQQMMKEKGPIRKPPPVTKTRSKMCKEAPVEVREELQELLKQYEDIFPEQLPKGKPPKRMVEFEIKTEEGQPHQINLHTGSAQGARRAAGSNRRLTRSRAYQALHQSVWRTGLVVPEKDGRWRMCVDYRALNRQTICDRYPLPRIDDLLDRLGKARHFTTLDLASGYHQIAVKDEDIPKTAFRTQRGQFEFVVMPFGVTNAPATFQRMMNSIFKEELDDSVLVYLDDILIFSRMLKEHIQHITRSTGEIESSKTICTSTQMCILPTKGRVPRL